LDFAGFVPFQPAGPSMARALLCPGSPTAATPIPSLATNQVDLMMNPLKSFAEIPNLDFAGFEVLQIVPMWELSDSAVVQDFEAIPANWVPVDPDVHLNSVFLHSKSELVDLDPKLESVVTVPNPAVLVDSGVD